VPGKASGNLRLTVTVLDFESKEAVRRATRKAMVPVHVQRVHVTPAGCEAERERVCDSIWETVASPQPSTAQMKFGYQCSSKRIISSRPLCTPRPTPSHFNDAHTRPSTPHQQQVPSRPSTCPVCNHLNLTIMDIVAQTVYASEWVSAAVTVSPSPATHSAVERLQEKRDGRATSGHASRDGT
jgi:hypothetical protein